MFFLLTVNAVVINPPQPNTSLNSILQNGLKVEDAFVFGVNSQSLRTQAYVDETENLKIDISTIRPAFCKNDPLTSEEKVVNTVMKFLMKKNSQKSLYINMNELNTVKYIVKHAFSLYNTNTKGLYQYLTISLANIFHGTSYLKRLYGSGGFFGIMQLGTSYMSKASTFSDINYVNTPIKLAEYTEKATLASMKTFDSICCEYKNSLKDKKSGFTFYDSMKALNLEALRRKGKDGPFAEEISNRVKIYKELCGAFNIHSNVGE